MKIRKVHIGCWVMVQWTDGITTGILADWDSKGGSFERGDGSVFDVTEGHLHTGVERSQILKVGKHVEFDPEALGFKPLK